MAVTISNIRTQENISSALSVHTKQVIPAQHFLTTAGWTGKSLAVPMPATKSEFSRSSRTSMSSTIADEFSKEYTNQLFKQDSKPIGARI
jgi:hypothetical protein